MDSLERAEKFKPLKTVEVTCKECGHKGKIEVTELQANTAAVNFVANIRHDAAITSNLFWNKAYEKGRALMREEAAKVAENLKYEGYTPSGIADRIRAIGEEK